MSSNNTALNNMYIADLEICTPLSNDVAELNEKIQANDNEFSIANFDGSLGLEINMSLCEPTTFSAIKQPLQVDESYSYRDRILVKMAGQTLAPLLTRLKQYSPTLAPLILALPEQIPHHKPIAPQLLANAIREHLGKAAEMIHWNQFMPVTIGRAGVLAALSLAQKLFQQNNGIELIVIGGIDSYRHSEVLLDLCKQQRITRAGFSGFVAGEGAGFLVITNNKKYALKANEGYVQLHPPGLAVEQGYLGSQEPNLGQGLTKAIKTALDSSPNLEINQIYSSMNGEAIWAEEHIASTLRHRHQLGDNIEEKTLSIAYNIGDIGSASGALSIALSAHKLFSDAQPQRHLITSGSDKNQRSAMCLTFEPAEANKSEHSDTQDSVKVSANNEQDDR